MMTTDAHNYVVPPARQPASLACQACLTRAAVLKVGVVIESSGGWQAGRDAHTGIELAKEDFLRAGTTLGNW
jgi:hypothetical protein